MAKISPPNSASSVNVLAQYNAPFNFTNKSTVTINNIPDYQFSSGIENGCIMHYGSGLINNSNFSSSYASIISAAQRFARRISKSSYGFPNTNICYYLYGERRGASGTEFHSGVDFRLGDNTPIYSSHSGVVTYSGGNYGTVSIYDSNLDVTYNYVHMKNISVTSGQFVSAWDKIGHQGAVGAPQGSHLHFEVRNGNTPRPAGLQTSTGALLPTLMPYGYM
ncbi:MAG: M23 family metallopeptidase [Oscillospiraceae bacterium]